SGRTRTGEGKDVPAVSKMFEADHLGKHHDETRKPRKESCLMSWDSRQTWITAKHARLRGSQSAVESTSGCGTSSPFISTKSLLGQTFVEVTLHRRIRQGCRNGFSFALRGNEKGRRRIDVSGYSRLDVGVDCRINRIFFF